MTVFNLFKILMFLKDDMESFLDASLMLSRLSKTHRT
jgi:hypothetical protein